MKDNIIFISNSVGGIKTFEDILIKFIHIKRIKCIVINNIYYNKKDKQKINHYKSNVIKQPLNTFKILNKIKKRTKNANQNFLFIFSNPIIYVIYFLYIKIFYNKNKIYFFVHSHLTKKNVSLYLITLISSIFFLFTNRVYYVSRFTRKWWERIYFFPLFTKGIIQYNSIILPRHKKKKTNKKFRIGFVGRIDREKGLDVFLDIAHKNKKNYIFNVFSEQHLKLNTDQKKYINFFYREKKSTIYNNIDLLLITSPIENCPYAVLEAKSLGIPTLSVLTKGGINEIIKNNYDGIIIKSNKKIINIKKFIDKIRSNYKFFSDNSLKEAEKYSARIKIPLLIKNIIF